MELLSDDAKIKDDGLYGKNTEEAIKKVAAQYGDVVLPISRLQADGIHPSWAGYKDLADRSK